jgi:hypothetical protein
VSRSFIPSWQSRFVNIDVSDLLVV